MSIPASGWVLERCIRTAEARQSFPWTCRETDRRHRVSRHAQSGSHLPSFPAKCSSFSSYQARQSQHRLRSHRESYSHLQQYTFNTRTSQRLHKSLISFRIAGRAVGELGEEMKAPPPFVTYPAPVALSTPRCSNPTNSIIRANVDPRTWNGDLHILGQAITVPIHVHRGAQQPTADIFRKQQARAGDVEAHINQAFASFSATPFDAALYFLSRLIGPR